VEEAEDDKHGKAVVAEEDLIPTMRSPTSQVEAW
jgi:hypothetical protein